LQECPISMPENGLSECSDILRNAYIACQCELHIYILVMVLILHGICKYFAAPLVSIDNCEEGAVRLINGQNVREGLVQVCINQAWGTVCSNLFSVSEAEVVCSQMNFERTGECFDSTRFLNYQFYFAIEGAMLIDPKGPKVDSFTPIFLSELNCQDMATTILSCSRAVGIIECRHSMDVYVSCEGEFLFLFSSFANTAKYKVFVVVV